MAKAEEKLMKLMQDIAKKENYENGEIKIKPISSGGANYSSSLHVATVSKQNKPDLHLFAKVANIGEELRASNPNTDLVYATEGIFYEKLVPDFTKIYNKYNIGENDRLFMAKYYGHILTPGTETMVLENLDIKGFKSFDRMKPVTWEYASTAVRELAKFHAIGLALREESPIHFENIVKQIGISFVNDIQILKYIADSIKNTCNLLNEEYKLKLEQFCDEEWVAKLLTDFMGKGSMLVHSDFRPSNLMHRQHNGKLEIVTLDYQTIRIGNPVMDLIFFIFTGSDEEFRRLHYRQLLDHYFTQLTLRLKQFQVDVEKVYPKKTYENDLKEFQLYGLLISLAGTGVVVVDPEEAPQSTDLSSMQVKPNQRALERIDGVIRDYIRWGVL